MLPADTDHLALKCHHYQPTEHDSMCRTLKRDHPVAVVMHSEIEQNHATESMLRCVIAILYLFDGIVGLKTSFPSLTCDFDLRLQYRAPQCKRGFSTFDRVDTIPAVSRHHSSCLVIYLSVCRGFVQIQSQQGL